MFLKFILDILLSHPKPRTMYDCSDNCLYLILIQALTYWIWEACMKRWYHDYGLHARMVLTMFLLAAVYLFFLAVLRYGQARPRTWRRGSDDRVAGLARCMDNQPRSVARPSGGGRDERLFHNPRALSGLHMYSLIWM